MRTERAKIVFLAPDTEASAAIDAKLMALVEESKLREVPIVYCMSRRRLGRAVGSSMKQSAVAVLNPDGVYELYKKIVSSVGLSVVSKNKY